MTTKTANGTILSIKSQTAAKMFVGSAVDKSLVPGAAAGTAGGIIESAISDKLNSPTCDPCKCQ